MIVHLFDLNELGLLLDASEVNEEGGEDVSLIVEPEEERLELAWGGRKGGKDETVGGELKKLDEVRMEQSKTSLEI